MTKMTPNPIRVRKTARYRMDSVPSFASRPELGVRPCAGLSTVNGWTHFYGSASSNWPQLRPFDTSDVLRRHHQSLSYYLESLILFLKSVVFAEARRGSSA